MGQKCSDETITGYIPLEVREIDLFFFLVNWPFNDFTRKNTFFLHVKKAEMDRGYNKTRKEKVVIMCQLCERISLFTLLVQGLCFIILLACLVSPYPKEHTHICMHTSTHFHFLHHLQYSLSWFLPSYMELWLKSAALCCCNIFTQVCGLNTAVCFSLSAVGQYSGFTQGAKVLMLHALKKYKMSSLQL